MLNKKVKLTVLFVILSFSLSACSLPFKSDNEVDIDQEVLNNEDLQEEEDEVEKIPEKTGRMKKFKSQQDLEAFLVSNSGETSLGVTEGKKPVVSLSYFPDDADLNLKTADLISYENNFAFALVKDKVKVMRLNASDTEVLSEISFDSRPSGLILNKKSLIVYGEDQVLTKSENSPFYFVKIFNLDQPSEPKLVNNYSFEGLIKNLFVEDDHLYLITETSSGPDSRQQRLARIYRDNNLLSSDCDGVEQCFDPEVFYFDLNYGQTRFLNINTLDLNNSFSSIKGSIYLLNEDHKAYVSQSSVFISFFKGSKEDDLIFDAKRKLIYDKLDEVEKNKITEIEILSDFVLNKTEKRKRVALVLDSYKTSLTDEEKKELDLEVAIEVKKIKSRLSITNENKIHKIRLKEGNVDYFAVGSIKGEIFNNYSVLEKDGFVYFGTSNGDRLNSDNELRYYVNVYILDSSMKDVGKVENLASKESLYGVRFSGDRAFLVSSEEEGSLFVIDLSDKSQPKFAGVVKLPGTDIQLLPVDKNSDKLISLAYNKGLDEDKKRIKLSLLDISNIKEPAELASYLLGESSASSIVFSDKKAFSYSPSTGLIMAPVALENEEGLYFSGLFAFKILNDKLEMVGQVDHSKGGFYNSSDKFASFSYKDNTVKRSFNLDNIIYSYSNKFLTSVSSEDFDDISFLSLTDHSDDILVEPEIENEEDPLMDYPNPEEYLDQEYQEDYLEQPPVNEADFPVEDIEADLEAYMEGNAEFEAEDMPLDELEELAV